MVLLIVGLAIILVAAAIFTNGIEWVGKRLNLSQGAVGSVLAAVGTALPESIIPVYAILFGTSPEAKEHVSIGAILGAPFMLSTLALFVVGVSVILFRHRRTGARLSLDKAILQRDLGFFLAVFPVALLASLVPPGLGRWVITAGLIVVYVYYVWITLRSGETVEGHEVGPLYVSPRRAEPSLAAALVQVVGALLIMVAGAHYFVDALVKLADAIGVSVVLLALVLTPVATELPEKFNSVIWLRGGKDTLALGNITGAMVFQSSIIPALGIALTPWRLEATVLVSSLLALLSGGLVYLMSRSGRPLTGQSLLYAGSLYGLFILYVALGFAEPNASAHG